MNYKESITALLEGLKGIFENKTATEASAIAQAATKPSTIFYTSDTHAIVVGGHVYGRSNQVSADAPFAYLPADVSSPSADPQFDGNHDTIYIQPIKTGTDAGKIKLWWYVNGAWTSTDTLDLVLPTEASQVTYDLTNTPDLGSGDVQSAVEALDGKVEDLMDEVLGDEWVDEIFGRKADWIRQYCYLGWNGNIGYSSYSDCYGFEIKAGDTFHFIDRRHSMNPMWIAYTEFKDLTGSSTYSGTMPTKVSDECDPYNIGKNKRVIDHVQTFGSETKMLIVAIEHNADWYQRITSNRGTPLSIADKTGYKIDTWTDDEYILLTTLTIGSIMPSWTDGERQGSRGVRLDVKEGDKILLDTYSPALFGLIFTDENRVVKALYNDRRFDGVWTAPCDGYCYIQDVLYRENYHYASAHGHLAYMAHDARKRVAKGGDWYNELAPKKLNAIFPFTSETTPAVGGPQYYIGSNGIATSTGNAFLTYYNALNTGKMQYKLVAVHAVIHEDGTTAKGFLADVYYNSTTSTLKVHYGEVVGEFTDGDKSAWTVVIKHATSYAQAGFGLHFNCQTAGSLKMTIDKAFVHTSSDFAELYALAQKIINGEVEVDNFYGVKEKEVDFVRNAIGLQSISDLGYNILNHGATLPIDEEGYKYGISEKARQDAYSSVYFYTGNEDLVYMPSIDFTKLNNSLYKFCEAAHNLITIPDIVAEGKVVSLGYTFRNCWSLKRVGDIKINVNGIGRAFESCYALEYIGRIATFDDNIRTSEKTNVFSGCYSLERIEELNMYRWGGNNFNQTIFNNCINLRYLLIKGFGSWSVVTWPLQDVLAAWGIPNDKHPDARQSLVDSLLTYSYDRVNDPDNLGTAETTCTITLSANSYAQLTASEIEAITAKGYTLTHP